MTHEESARLEYAALMRRVADAERMTFQSWMSAGLAGVLLLAWGIASRNSGFMVPVVLASACGFLTMGRWQEQAQRIAGYLEAYHESQHGLPAFFTRSARLQGTAWDGGGREWHAPLFFNAMAAFATVFAWTMADAGAHGELWAGVVTGGTLAFAFWSLTETARQQKADATSLWRRSEGGLREVSPRVSAR